MLLTMVPERAWERHPKRLTPRSLGAQFYTQKYTFFRVDKQSSAKRQANGFHSATSIVLNSLMGMRAATRFAYSDWSASTK